MSDLLSAVGKGILTAICLLIYLAIMASAFIPNGPESLFFW